MYDLENIGTRLKRLREGKDMNQEELAALLKVPRSTVAKWETGRQDFKSEVIVFLADYFGVSADYLLRGVSPENKPLYDITGLEDHALEGLTQYVDESNSIFVNRLLMDKKFYELLSELKRLMNRRIKAINIIDFKWATMDANKKIEEERITKAEMVALCQWRMKEAIDNYFSDFFGFEK